MQPAIKTFLLTLLILISEVAGGDVIRIATASNFMTVMPALADAFEAQSGHTVILIPGSSGKHYAQILNGAPFEAFFSADARRPAELERRGRIVDGSRYTYAIGRLVLWSPVPGLVGDGADTLGSGAFRRLAIANPRLAPYGEAARQTLESLGLWNGLQDRLVRGENVAQAFQFVHSGNAELGLVALSQLVGRDGGSQWLVPAERYAPIEQQAVLLREGPARSFLDWVRSEAARDIIEAGGYLAPGSPR
ncbi:MAG: molybdate ABC transporter substrate-binding protein [Xanthomonadales bacterium]|nr:molybdate ABC transporter substrate-binding protein [Xanthomonadales bacterium]